MLPTEPEDNEIEEMIATLDRAEVRFKDLIRRVHELDEAAAAPAGKIPEEATTDVDANPEKTQPTRVDR